MAHGSPSQMGRMLAILVCSLGVSGTASAQPSVAVIYTSEPGARAVETWREHVERAATASGRQLVDDPVTWARDRAGEEGDVLPARVEAFREVSRRLVAAREATVALREGDALAELARAERIAEDHADVPGAAAWLAEVHTAIGITAAQAGMGALTEDALAKAATLDPTRSVRAAEAPPEVIARADAIARAVATRETGSFEVHASAEGARIFLDDEEIGPAPRLVRAPVGLHLLRVIAPGHLPWGRAIQVLEGRRPTMDIALAPDHLVGRARSLVDAAEAQDGASIVAALQKLPGMEGAWVIHIGPAPEDRAIFLACSAEGCAEPRRLEIDEVPIVIPRERMELSRVAAALDAGAAWLRTPRPPPPPPPPPGVWDRWVPWVASAILVGAAIAGTIVLAMPEPEQRRRVILDPDF